MAESSASLTQRVEALEQVSHARVVERIGQVEQRVSRIESAREAEEPHVATKADIARLETLVVEFRGESQAQISDFRAEMQTQIGDLRAEMQTQIGDSRAESKAQIGELRAEMGDLRAEMQTQIGDSRAESKAQIGELRAEMGDLRRGNADADRRLARRVEGADW